MCESKYKAILYVRTATVDQHIPLQHNALMHQEKALKDYCAIHRIGVISVYREISSGRTFNRPEFIKLLKFLKTNRGMVNTILVTSMDRFSRGFDNAIEMMEQLNRLGVEVKSIQQTGEIIRSGTFYQN